LVKTGNNINKIKCIGIRRYTLVLL